MNQVMDGGPKQKTDDQMWGEFPAICKSWDAMTAYRKDQAWDAISTAVYQLDGVKVPGVLSGVLSFYRDLGGRSSIRVILAALVGEYGSAIPEIVRSAIASLSGTYDAEALKAFQSAVAAQK